MLKSQTIRSKLIQLFYWLNEMIELDIIKNMQSAPNMGKKFGQDVEPKGTYVLAKTSDYLAYPWVQGKAQIMKPLVVNISDETQISYKQDLANQYKAKGQKLTNKLMSMGYDALITKYPDGSTGEIVLFPNAKFMLDTVNENKTLIKTLLRENLQQADKLYFKNGKLSEKARQIILMITKGDSFTKLVSDMYYAELIQNHKNGEWISKTMDKNHKETDKPNNDVLDNNTLKELQVFHQDLVNYNKNVFPIKDFNINGVENIHYFMSALKQRRLILKMFGELPSIATRNMKGDIRQERTYPELQNYRSDLEYFMSFYSMLSNRDENAKKKIELKMFKNNITLEELLRFAEEKENLVGGTKFTKNKVKQIVKEDGYDLAIVYEKNNIMIVEVSGPDGIKKIGCNSLWCFTYGSGFNNAYRNWNNYSTNDFVYVIIDFNQSPDSPEFMHVLIKPLQDEYDDEDDNPSTLFDMSNEVQYNPNRIITNYIDFETAKKIMNFGEEIEEPEQTQQKKVSYKDPNQLSLFEIKQKLREALLPEVTTGKSFTAYHGSSKEITNFSDEFLPRYENKYKELFGLIK